MKNWIIILSMGILLSSCSQNFLNGELCNGGGNCTGGNGIVASQNIPDIANFQSIRHQTSATILLTQGTEQSIRIEGEDNILEFYDFNVNDGVLTVNTRDCICTTEEVKIYVTLPVLKSVFLDSTGEIVGQNTFTNDELDIIVDGPGDVLMDVVASKINITNDSSGELKLKGTSEVVDINLLGTGEVYLFGLETQIATIFSDGPGEVEITVNDRIDVQIESTGDIFYKGNPEVSLQDNGLGDLVKVN